jgi:DNA-binding NarL/FixJ family response regulator
MVDRIRIGVVDEHPLFRQGVVRTIERHPRMVVVAEGSSANDARKIAAQTELHILLLGMRGGDLAIAREVLAAQAGLRVVILTASDDEEHLSEAIRAGASGYILKGVSAIELLRAMDVIHRGEPYITPSLASRVLMQLKIEPVLVSADATEERRVELTRREQQVLGHVTQGLTNMEIAAELGVSITAIKHSMSNVFRKIRVRNRVEAVSMAQKLRLV